MILLLTTFLYSSSSNIYFTKIYVNLQIKIEECVTTSRNYSNLDNLCISNVKE